MDKSPLIKQLGTILDQADRLKPNNTLLDVQRIITLALAAIDRIAGPSSAYAKQADRIINIYPESPRDHLPQIVGVIQSLKLDVDSGHLQSVAELIHGDVFGDFLEMAAYLSQEKYKDAAAVIAGSTLEAHLRQLCQKNQIATETTSSSEVRAKKADTINSDLTKAGAYSKLDQKNVTAWLGLRNNAAHGDYGAYTPEQVNLAIDGIRDFITRAPA